MDLVASLLLVVRPGAPSSILAPSSDATGPCPNLFRLKRDAGPCQRCGALKACGYPSVAVELFTNSLQSNVNHCVLLDLAVGSLHKVHRPKQSCTSPQLMHLTFPLVGCVPTIRKNESPRTRTPSLGSFARFVRLGCHATIVESCRVYSDR